MEEIKIKQRKINSGPRIKHPAQIEREERFDKVIVQYRYPRDNATQSL